MIAPHVSVVTARRLGALAFALVLSAQPVILCCSAHAASPSGARHHDGASHHDGGARHHGDAIPDVPPAPTVSTTCTTYVPAPALRERTREAAPILALPASPAALRLRTQPCSEIGRHALISATLSASRRATPLRL